MPLNNIRKRLSMKKYIFALLAMTSILFSSVKADELFTEQGLYASAFAGANFLQVKEVNGIKSGLMGGFSIGYKCENTIRAECEFSYRRNKKVSTSLLSSEGSRQTCAVLANVYYDFEVESDYKPYIGFGAGYAHNRVVTDVKNGGSYTYNNKLAYQFMGGFNYKVSDKTYVAIEYKFLCPEKSTQHHTTSASVKRYF